MIAHLSHNSLPPGKRKRRPEGECHWDEGDWVWDESYPLYELRNCELWTKRSAVQKMEGLIIPIRNGGGNPRITIFPARKSSGCVTPSFYECKVSNVPCYSKVAKVEMLLKLDVMDSSSLQWRYADILIFNTGYWWNHCKINKRGCYFQIGDNVKTDMSIESAYRKSIETLFLWISKEVDSSKTVIFRTYAPPHYRDRESVGHCQLKLKPEISSSLLLSSPSWAFLVNHIIELSSAINLELFLWEIMNVTQMTALRPDGHPSIYYLGATAGPAALNEQDCRHWCLPRIPDTWNELLYARILTGYLL